MLIDEILTLRNSVHKGEFRFDLTPSLWKSDYLSGKEPEVANVLVVRRSGVLKGYAICSFLSNHEVRACGVLEICADGEATLFELIDKIIEKGKKEDVDFIFLRRCEEPFDEVFKKKGFSTFLESVIMVALFNPKELLSSLSKKIEHGKIIKLVISGFGPVTIRVGRKEIMVANDITPEFMVQTNPETFLCLLFGKKSFLKEFLMRRISISKISGLRTVIRFFDIIRTEKWYIPSGDWC